MPQALYKSRPPTRDIPYNLFNSNRPRNLRLLPPITTTTSPTKVLPLASAYVWRAPHHPQHSLMGLPTLSDRKACRLLHRDLAVPSSSSHPRTTSYSSTSKRRRTSPGSRSPISFRAEALARSKYVTARSSRQRQPSGRMRW